MKPALLTLLLLPFSLALHAQIQFDCGSTGAYGAMTITENTTLPLPADGIFHCTTISVANGATLRFTRNANNTPVHLLAQGDVTISGTIDVSGANALGGAGGAGGPGGFDGGNGGSLASAGHGPGGGDVYNSTSQTKSMGSYHGGQINYIPKPYGNPLLLPLIGGSGAGGGANDGGGGGGGGAILIASNTRIDLNGSLYSRGGRGYYTNLSDQNHGSGGAIRLVTPVMTGSGNVQVEPSQSAYFFYPGRVRLDTLDRTNFSGSLAGEVFYGNASVGANMMVFAPNLPKLRISKINDTVMPENPSTPLYFLLPPGSPNPATIEITASYPAEFTSPYPLPIRVVFTPNSGPRIDIDAVINGPFTPSATTTITQLLTPGLETKIDVWSR
ncbi:MAG: hypothetical protein SFY80_16875 [Verrucomicrobiota bacterium]|nr:hypothetical protein [Verrucomicrobiota bacterium]